MRLGSWRAGRRASTTRATYLRYVLPMATRGILYMGLAALFFSVMSALVKVAGARLPTEEVVLARVVVTLVISYALVRRAALSPWGTDRRRLALRGFVGTTALACYYWTITHMPLADATTIYHVAPVITAVRPW